MNEDQGAPVKCVMILSDKSSGSSMLQFELGKHPEIARIRSSSFNFESKYWAYSTSILGLPQPRMDYSYEFPIGKHRAVRALNRLFSMTGVQRTVSSSSTKEELFEGWIALCSRFSPIFLEKSPHHLHYWEALLLMQEFTECHPETDLKFIGLIRNPVDTLYSMWKRWYAIPEQRQFEWLRAYRNLYRFKSMMGEKMLIVRYEDIVSDCSRMQDVYGFLGVSTSVEIESGIHGKSLQKWKRDSGFGFQLDDSVKHFASEHYDASQLENSGAASWKFVRTMARPGFRWKVTKGKTIRFLMKLKRILRRK